MTWPYRRGKPAEPPAHYELRVKGVLDSGWSAWIEGLRVTSDQAALHGLLAKAHDPGLPLLEVRRIDPD
jgi:hypothetical protein